MIPAEPGSGGESDGVGAPATPLDTQSTATAYERGCRRLLVAFPSDFRRSRGDDLVAALLDDASRASKVSVRTAANLVATGIRMRARRAGGDRGTRGWAAGGLDMAAVAGLALQSSLAVASAVFFFEHRVIFFLYLQHTDYPGVPGYISPDTVGHWIGADFPATWIGLATIYVLAFAAAVRGHFRPAGVLNALATAYVLAVLAVSLRAQSAVRGISCDIATLGPLAPHSSSLGVIGNRGVKVSACSSSQIRAIGFYFRYGQFVSTPAILAIFVVVTTLTIAAARRHRQSAPRRTWWWLAAAAGLALVFVAVGDGHQPGPGDPLQGGVMTSLGYLWAIGVVVTLVWCWFDPRVGWAAAVLSVPFLVYQLTAPNFAFPIPTPSSFDHRLLLTAAGAAIAVLGTNATISGWRLRRQ